MLFPIFFFEIPFQGFVFGMEYGIDRAFITKLLCVYVYVSIENLFLFRLVACWLNGAAATILVIYPKIGNILKGQFVSHLLKTCNSQRDVNCNYESYFGITESTCFAAVYSHFVCILNRNFIIFKMLTKIGFFPCYLCKKTSRTDESRDYFIKFTVATAAPINNNINNNNNSISTNELHDLSPETRKINSVFTYKTHTHILMLHSTCLLAPRGVRKHLLGSPQCLLKWPPS